MTTSLLLLPPVLSLAVLAAHFWRAANWPLALASVALVALLALPRAWVARAVQLALLLAAAEWLWTALMFVQQRLAFDRPWLRLALILGGVALFSAASALVFRHPGLARRYALGAALR